MNIWSQMKISLKLRVVERAPLRYGFSMKNRALISVELLQKVVLPMRIMFYKTIITQFMCVKSAFDFAKNKKMIFYMGIRVVERFRSCFMNLH